MVVCFYGLSTSRSFTDGTPIYCPSGRTYIYCGSGQHAEKV